MSVWKRIIEKDVAELSRINYAKLNCTLQDIADLFQKRQLTKLEVEFHNSRRILEFSQVSTSM